MYSLVLSSKICCVLLVAHSVLTAGFVSTRDNLHTSKIKMRQTLNLKMSIYPLSDKQFSKLSPRQVNMAQWYSYWGTNRKARLEKVLESLLIAYGGMWLSWFLSFMTGMYLYLSG